MKYKNYKRKVEQNSINIGAFSSYEHRDVADNYSTASLRTSNYLGDNLLSLYLHDMGKFDLLTPEQEKELTQTINKNKNDIESRNKLVEANLRLVIPLVKYYKGKGMDLMDLIQEGNLGLIKAAEMFDASKGFKFSTYAPYWINQSISRALDNQGSLIRIPVHLKQSINKVLKIQNKLVNKLSRMPDVEEISAETDGVLTVEEVNNLLSLPHNINSLNSIIGQDGEEIIDFIPDTEEELASNLNNEDDAKLLEKGLKALTPRERTIIGYLFGFNGGHEYTLQEVGDLMGLTRERIRQLRNKALDKMKSVLGEKSRK